MAFGKLFTLPDNPRTTPILAVAKANNLDLEVVDVDFNNVSEEHKSASALGKVPAFVGADGYTLSECIAIAIYITSQNEKTTLLGKTKQDYASILKWMSFFNSEVLPPMGAWYRPLQGKDFYNKKSVDEASKKAQKAIEVAEAHLLHNTFLVGERLTLADIFAASIASRGFQFFWDKQWRQENPNVSRWFQTVSAQPIFADVATKFALLDTPALVNTPPKKDAPKKEKKEAAPKQEKKAAPKQEEDDEEPAAPAPKAKHPCEALGKASIPLDELKRKYSNEETPDVIKWIWENVNFDEYSLWKMKFKYNDELTMTFMSNNLIGGFFTRLEGSRKFVFGTASVYGVTNDSVIQGVFLIRGQDHEVVFDVAPDWESYTFEKLDPTNEEDRKYTEAELSWDRDLVIDGKDYPHSEGKVFK